ncbi:hypothetical protein COCSADRAFT_182125 [Bipolaris sorokiniana ND90Pr]|uniref:Uncharacterized protein n=1 Tax=Cochliobolus sativus (strain ND90Pr / ATCC 201652) TaxID=665912 RepID=M2SKC1_COCSN|nr:uncharacterized protein COCSADRAFT_182125 [Bipolaris sorokiniana ND90Pr]EMD62770.1 hypothetical protein COCSADRAFT_182125 [Bipolaris sorokiniana ND90Pr]
MNPPYHHNDSFSMLGNHLYPETGFLDTSNIEPQVSPVGDRNGVAHSSGDLSRNDAPNSSIDESSPAWLGLLKQQVQLMIEIKKSILSSQEEIRKLLLSSQEESRRREAKFTKQLEDLERAIRRLQDHVKNHGSEPPQRRPYPYPNPNRPDRHRGPVPPQYPDPYGSLSAQEQLWGPNLY